MATWKTAAKRKKDPATKDLAAKDAKAVRGEGTKAGQDYLKVTMSDLSVSPWKP